MSQELNLWKRLQGETPLFFKRVIALSVTLAAVGGALIGAEAAVTAFVLPPFLHTLSQWFIVAGLVGGAVSKTTVVNPSVMINKFILDTQTSLFLKYDPEGSDVIGWVTGTLQAHRFDDAAVMQAQLDSLNANSPGRYIGAGGVGTPK